MSRPEPTTSTRKPEASASVRPPTGAAGAFRLTAVRPVLKKGAESVVVSVELITWG